MNKIINHVFLLIILTICVLSTDISDLNKSIKKLKISSNDQNCNLYIHEDFSTTSSPLFLTKDGKFLRASDTNGNIKIGKGEEIVVACPGSGNKLTNFNRNEVKLICDRGSKFKFTDRKKYDAKSIECLWWPASVIKRIGTCLSAYSLYQVGFEVSFGFVPLFEFCHDTKMSNTLYTKFLLTKESANSQRNVGRPSWQTGSLYGGVAIDDLYRKDQERRTFTKLLGSRTLAEKYIRLDNDYYLAKGHLVAKGDFFYGAQQVNTFWYGNAAPQWQTFNGQNWKTIEMAVRNFAGKYNQDLDVYTGTYGNDVLPHVYGLRIKLNLNGDGKVPVPMMFWKVVYDPRKKLGITIVGLNSPFIRKTIGQNRVCRDICDQIRWLTLDSSERANPKQGYLYCCDVNEFRKKVNNVPDINVVGILK